MVDTQTMYYCLWFHVLLRRQRLSHLGALLAWASSLRDTRYFCSLSSVPANLSNSFLNASVLKFYTHFIFQGSGSSSRFSFTSGWLLASTLPSFLACLFLGLPSALFFSKHSFQQNTLFFTGSHYLENGKWNLMTSCWHPLLFSWWITLYYKAIVYESDSAFLPEMCCVLTKPFL